MYYGQCEKCEWLTSSLIWNNHCLFIHLTGLSLRAGGRGFSPATKTVVPGYFYWKIEEKQNQKKSLAV